MFEWALRSNNKIVFYDLIHYGPIFEKLYAEKNNKKRPYVNPLWKPVSSLIQYWTIVFVHILIWLLVEAGKYEFKFKLVTPEKRMFTVGFHRDETIGILKVWYWQFEFLLRKCGLSYQRISGSNSKKAYGKWLRHDSKGKAAPSFQ